MSPADETGQMTLIICLKWRSSNAHGPGDADDEGKDGRDDERYERISIHQFRRVSPASGLPFHNPDDFLPLPSKVLDAIRGDVL